MTREIPASGAGDAQPPPHLGDADVRAIAELLQEYRTLPPPNPATQHSVAAARGGVANLLSAVAANRLHFLETELAVGHAMLDAAAVTREPAVQLRRVARAQAAYDEIARRLSADEAARFTVAERARLATRLAGLGTRLADAH